MPFFTKIFHNICNSRKYIICLITYLSFFTVGIFCWKNLSIKPNNPNGILGPSELIGLSPNVDYIGFLLFILSQTISALFITLILRSSKYWGIFNEGDVKDVADKPFSTKNKLFIFLIIIFILVSSISIPTYHANGKLDLFHEGESIGIAINALQGEIPYKDYIFLHGFFQDPGRTLLSFSIFGRSVGAVRTLESLLHVLANFLVGFVLFILFKQKIFYMLFCVGFIQLFQLLNSPFLPKIILPSRDIMLYSYYIIVIFILFQIKTSLWQKNILNRTFYFISFFMLSYIPIITYLYSIDRAIYLSFAWTILIVMILTIQTKSRDRLTLLFFQILGIGVGLITVNIFLNGALGSLISFVFVELPQWAELMFNKPVYTTFWARGILIYLILFSTCIFWIVSNCIIITTVKKSKIIALRFVLSEFSIEIFLLIMAAIVFKGALGRSDSEHFYYSTLPLLLAFFYTISRIWCQKGLFELNKVVKIPNYLTNSLCMICIFLVLIAMFYPKNSVHSKFPLHIKDSEFISKKQNEVISYLEKSLKDNETFVTLDNRAIWYYFLNRSCPIKFPEIWFAEYRPYQDQVSRQIEENPSIKYIIFESGSYHDSIDGIPNIDRVPHIIATIEKLYKLDIQLNGYKILVRKRLYPNNNYNAETR